CNPPSAYPFPDRKASPNEIPPGRLLPERIPFLSVCEYEPLWDVMYLSPWQKPQSKTEYHSPLPHKDNPTPENGRNYRTTVPPYRAVPSGSDRAHRGFRQWTFHYH